MMRVVMMRVVIIGTEKSKINTIEMRGTTGTATG